VATASPASATRVGGSAVMRGLILGFVPGIAFLTLISVNQW
jgi:hypothetical protein